MGHLKKLVKSAADNRVGLIIDGCCFWVARIYRRTIVIGDVAYQPDGGFTVR